MGKRNASGTVVEGRGGSSTGDGFAAYSVRDNPLTFECLPSTSAEVVEPFAILSLFPSMAENWSKKVAPVRQYKNAFKGGMSGLALR